MYLMVDANGIFQRKEISGWNKLPTAHAAALRYTDATMLYDGSIVGISAAGYPPLVAGRLHLLATPAGPAEVMDPNLGSAPVAVTTLLDGSILVLTAAGTLHQAPFVHGPWQQVTLPINVVPIDVAVSLDGHVLCLTAAGPIHRAAVAGLPAANAIWAVLPMPAAAVANVERIEFLRDGSLIAIDNANAVHLLPANQINVNGVWQALANVGPILSVTPLGGHTLLAIDPADHRLLTADAWPENWVQVGNQPPVPVLALAHLPAGQLIALGNNNQIYAAPYGPAVLNGPNVIGAFAVHIGTPPPVPAVSMTAHPRGKITVVGNNNQLYNWETGPVIGQQNAPPRWESLNTAGTTLRSVTYVDGGSAMYGIGQNGTDRLICRLDPTFPQGPYSVWELVRQDIQVSRAVTIRDGSILEVDAAGNALHRRARLRDDLVPCGWAEPCRQVIELPTSPQDTSPRAAKWLLQYSSDDQAGVLGDGRPWGDGTAMARRAQNHGSPWDGGSRVTPLIGGFAALSAMRDAFEAAIIDASASNNAPGDRGYVYIADWLLTPLRDLSEDNPWGGGAWAPNQQPVRDQTAIGLIARMMSAGINVRVLVWMPTTTQAVQVGAHARQHWHLARMVQLLNANLRNRGGQWTNTNTGVVALDLRTANVISVSLHQKMCVVRVGEVNVGFCGGVDLAYTRRDFRRPANSIIGTGDWQSGNGMPTVSGTWPQQAAPPLSGYPGQVQAQNDDVIADELGQNVYGVLRHWHDQHLKLEGPIVTSLEQQFDERWRVPGTPVLFNSGSAYGGDGRVIFTSAIAFNNQGILPLDITPCPPVGSAVVQLWRTIPVDRRRKDRSPFRRGEFTVMAGIANAVKQATQLITIWDQYFWSEPMALLLADRLQAVPGLRVLVVLPPYGSNDPVNELRYRRKALQTLWNALTPLDRTRLIVRNLWTNNVGVYVHAKVQTYDDCLLVCGSANLNRRSLTLDMELDCAVMHKPDVCYHLANLAHMLTGQPWTDLDLGWLQRYWTHMTTQAAATTIADPFYCDANQIGQATPNGVQYAPGGQLPEWIMEPTPFSADIDAVNSGQFQNAVGTTGHLDFLVWLLEKYNNKGEFTYREPKLL
jgi:phosphatidylserine/phosphatidylglycerophosphate/cardiolipin synthase-like enzyme